MPIGNITTDASGRTRDVSIFRGINPKGSAVITPTFGLVSQFCVGIQKLVQRYGIALFTIIGSQRDYPAFGTNFLSTLQTSNNILNQVNVQHIFNFANFEVVQSFRAYQATQTDLPLDEQLSTATLINFSAVGDTVSFNVQLTTMAGDTVDLVLPLPLTN